MQTMSFDPIVGHIAAQLVDNANLGLKAGAAAEPLTALMAAAGDEISAQAAAAFAQQAAQLLALSQAAQLELARTGEALAEIARMYTEVDASVAADVLNNPLSRYGLATI
jgi:hypothetical protein